MTMVRAISALLLILLFGFVTDTRAEGPAPIGILLAAGDIAHCDANKAEDEATAELISKEIDAAKKKKIPIRVLALGDLAYASR